MEEDMGGRDQRKDVQGIEELIYKHRELCNVWKREEALYLDSLGVQFYTRRQFPVG